jgi:hypothetical protein
MISDAGCGVQYSVSGSYSLLHNQLRIVWPSVSAQRHHVSRSTFPKRLTCVAFRALFHVDACDRVLFAPSWIESLVTDSV